MSPILLQIMIDKERISELVSEVLKEGMFIVDIRVSGANVIHVEIDSFEGLTIVQCVEVSRYIESHLDREQEDFELQVSSPGIDQLFRVKEQYRKNIGRELDVIAGENQEIRGKLVEADEKGILLEVTQKEKKEGERKKQEVTRMVPLAYDEIRKAKVVISFK